MYQLSYIISGSVIVDNCGKNLDKYCNIPKNSCSNLLSVGFGIFVIAATLPGSGDRPLSVSS